MISPNEALFIHVPMYQLSFEASCKGRVWAGSKRKIRWVFGYADHEALSSNEKGWACRGEEHQIDFEWSLASGKRRILLDGDVVHESTQSVCKGSSPSSWQFSHEFRLKGKNHSVSIKAMSLGLLGSTFDQSCVNLSFNGLPFCELPKLYELNQEIFSLYVAVPRSLPVKRQSMPFKSSFTRSRASGSLASTSSGSDFSDVNSRTERRRSNSAPARLIRCSADRLYFKSKVVRFARFGEPLSVSSKGQPMDISESKLKLATETIKSESINDLDVCDVTRSDSEEPRADCCCTSCDSAENEKQSSAHQDEEDSPDDLHYSNSSLIEGERFLCNQIDVSSSVGFIQDPCESEAEPTDCNSTVDDEESPFLLATSPRKSFNAGSLDLDSIETCNIEKYEHQEHNEERIVTFELHGDEFRSEDGSRVSVNDAIKFVEDWSQSAPRFERRRLEIALKGARLTQITTTSVLTFASNLTEIAPMYERRRQEIASKRNRPSPSLRRNCLSRQA